MEWHFGVPLNSPFEIKVVRLDTRIWVERATAIDMATVRCSFRCKARFQGWPFVSCNRNGIPCNLPWMWCENASSTEIQLRNPSPKRTRLYYPFHVWKKLWRSPYSRAYEQSEFFTVYESFRGMESDFESICVRRCNTNAAQLDDFMEMHGKYSHIFDGIQHSHQILPTIKMLSHAKNHRVGHKSIVYEIHRARCTRTRFLAIKSAVDACAPPPRTCDWLSRIASSHIVTV